MISEKDREIIVQYAKKYQVGQVSYFIWIFAKKRARIK